MPVAAASYRLCFSVLEWFEVRAPPVDMTSSCGTRPRGVTAHARTARGPPAGGAEVWVIEEGGLICAPEIDDYYVQICEASVACLAGETWLAVKHRETRLKNRIMRDELGNKLTSYIFHSLKYLWT